jgi:hypothetical protein
MTATNESPSIDQVHSDQPAGGTQADLREWLLEQRRQLTADIAYYWARHADPGGTWTSHRHHLRAKLAEEAKAQAIAAGEKWTEAGVERWAEAQPVYEAYLAEADAERAKYFTLTNAIQEVEDRLAELGA